MTNPRQRRRRNNRPAIRPHRVARANNQVSMRRFRGTSRILFQQQSGGGGVEGGFSIASAISDYIGSSFISDNFEQYKVTNVEVLMKPSAAALSPPTTTQDSIIYQNSVYSAMNQTYVQSFIDYDSDQNPSFAECQTRPNLKVRALMPNNWTKIASFSPKTLSNQSATGSAPTITFANEWLSTNNLTTLQFGVRGLCTNDSPVFDTQDNICSVDVRVTATVHMRGPKNDTTEASLTQLSISKPLVIESANDSEENKSSPSFNDSITIAEPSNSQYVD